MQDLRLAMALMMFMSVAAFLGVRRLCANGNPRVLDGAAAVTVVIVGVYIRLVWGQLWIVKWIPLPSVVILSNWFPVLLGIEASEKEMAQLCLTGEGTTWLGLYHGLSIRLQGTRFHAEFFEGDLEVLDIVAGEFPVLMCCKLSDSVDQANPDYKRNGGWIPGVAHSVVLFRRAGEDYLIGDPSQKDAEFWTTQDVENLWTGQGLRIVANANGR